jgi:hypothetical protein
LASISAEVITSKEAFGLFETETRDRFRLKSRLSVLDDIFAL